MAVPVANPKTTLYVGGLDETVTEAILHAAFIPFGDIKDINTPLDQATQKHRGFGFITYMEAEDAAAAMDNMNNAELYGRVLTVNLAQPIKIKGGEQGWANQPVWAEADTWFERQQQEEELERLKKEHDENVRRGREQAKVQAPGQDTEEEEPTNEQDPMRQAERQAVT
jgi:peptidyl-prolyl isomerase E (cyclophilin E)